MKRPTIEDLTAEMARQQRAIVRLTAALKAVGPSIAAAVAGARAAMSKS